MIEIISLIESWFDLLVITQICTTFAVYWKWISTVFSQWISIIEYKPVSTNFKSCRPVFTGPIFVTAFMVRIETNIVGTIKVISWRHSWWWILLGRWFKSRWLTLWLRLWLTLKIWLRLWLKILELRLLPLSQCSWKKNKKEKVQYSFF